MTYRVGEFATLTGVTVRALQHYDRLGLLRPSRTESGHRVYAESDQARVRHILALRAVGMSLQQIRDALDAPASRVAELFQAQRASLEQSRISIEEAIRALRQLETPSPEGESLLVRLTSNVEMQDALESMRTYFSDDAWTNWGRRYFHDWPPAAWRALFRDIEAALDEDPSSDRAQDLLDRSTALWNSDIGSNTVLARSVGEGYGKAWNARDRWPRELQRRYAEFRIGEIARFLGDASMASWRRRVASWRRRGLVHTYTTGRRSTRSV